MRSIKTYFRYFAGRAQLSLTSPEKAVLQRLFSKDVKPSSDRIARRRTAHAQPFENLSPATRDIIEWVVEPLSRCKGLSIYIHGSYADETRCSFSDLDTLILVDAVAYQERHRAQRQQLADALQLSDLRMMQVDPLQHHGHWIIQQQELESMDESYLPLVVLEGAAAVRGPLQITANVYLSNQAISKNLHALSDAITRRVGEAMSVYDLKHVVSGIALLPAYVSQAQGLQLSKAEALTPDSLRRLFSAHALSAVEWATDLRANWRQLLEAVNMQPLQNFSHSAQSGSQVRLFARCFAPKTPKTILNQLPIDSLHSLIHESVRSSRE